MNISGKRAPVVAIDGPVGAGKSTVARLLAQRLGYRYVDTGAMYRSVALAAARQRVDLRDEPAVVRIAESLTIEFRSGPEDDQRVMADGVDVTEAIRTPDVSDGASIVSMYSGVRRAMVAVQRRLGAGGAVVMEGRDIGTVVFPDAEVKVFLDASLDERARRRYEELRGRGASVDLAGVRHTEEERDRRDATRTHSPLRAAPDAVIIDSTDRSVEETVAAVMVLVARRQSASRGGLRAVVGEAWYHFWKNFVYVVGRVAFRMKVEGLEHVPKTGALIVAGNHASAIDPPLVGSVLRRRAGYMAKEELFSIPVLGAWLRSIGVFPVKRGTADRRAIRRSIHTLEQGGILVMFPEGTRSEDGRLRDPEPGAAMIALRTGAPVLPVAVVGSHKILPRTARWPHFAQVVVRIGPMLPVPRIEGRLDHQVLETWGRRIMAEIAKLLPEDQLPIRESVNRES
ncbi:MAG TPA: (d)CMP kinase [bacterium]|jgi:cytidylate kinase|nr:(d)CMP kinase [bacterium]